MIRQGTTPVHTFTLPVDTATIAKARILYGQEGTVVVQKDTPDITMEGNTLTVHLTQEDTLRFDPKRLVTVQVRVVTQDGDALVSDGKSVSAGMCLDQEVL